VWYAEIGHDRLKTLVQKSDGQVATILAAFNPNVGQLEDLLAIESEKVCIDSFLCVSLTMCSEKVRALKFTTHDVGGNATASPSRRMPSCESIQIL
jgi:hypothetical protein